MLARIRGLDDRTVQVDFEWRGRLVGPRLKLGKPQRMIKVEGEG